MNTFAKTLAGLSLALSVGMSGAEARILAFGSYQPTILVAGTGQPLLLTGAGARAVTFRTNANNKFVAVTHFAECVTAGELGDYLSVRIAVDGVAAHPRAGATFALCSATDPKTDVHAGVSRQALILVPNAGQHRVEVFASKIAVNGATRLALQNTSIVVQD